MDEKQIKEEIIKAVKNNNEVKAYELITDWVLMNDPHYFDKFSSTVWTFEAPSYR